jgi:hypothetical protein
VHGGISEEPSTILSWYCFTLDVLQPADRRPECGRSHTVGDPLIGPRRQREASPDLGAES